jgi:hypothetical protein
VLLLALSGSAAAQGCGSTNPNCIVPTVQPFSTNDNRAASTAFVQGALGGGGGGPTAPYMVNGGTVNRSDQARWVDNFVEAPEIGVDCSGVTDSTTVIQNYVNANTRSGHIRFPSACQILTSGTILLSNTINFTFDSDFSPGGGGGPVPRWLWAGGNGGTACGNNTGPCKFILDFEHSDHPRVEKIAFENDSLNTGWVGDAGCSDGFIKFDGDPDFFIGTAGHVLTSTFNNSTCNNPNFIAISISPTAANNHENYYIFDTTITCGAHAPVFASRVGVTNGTTTVTAANAPFSAGNVNRRIRITHSGGEFDSTIAAFVSATQVTLAGAVPWSDTNQMIHIQGGDGIGIRNGASQNAIQQVIYKYNYSQCEVGYLQQGGNASVTQAQGGQSDYGQFIGGFTAQNTQIDYPAAESNFIDQFFQSSNVAPSSLSHARWSNGFPSAVGFVIIGAAVSVSDGEQDFDVPTANANFFSPSYTFKINSIGTVAGGSAYTNGTYTNVPLLVSQGFGGAGPSGVGGDIGIKGTVVVSGGVVTTVTLTTPGTFVSFPFPASSNVASYSLTAAPANIGGTGSGFTAPITGIVTNPIPPAGGGMISTNNAYHSTYAALGLGTFAAALISLNDIGINGGFPGQQTFGCGNNSSTCVYYNFAAPNSGAIGSLLNIGTAIVGGGPSVGYKSTTNYPGPTHSAFQAVPNAARDATSQTMFESAANLATIIDTGSGLSAFYGFRAQAPANVTASLANAYGFRCEQQKVTNVAVGWCFYNANSADFNFFAGPVITAPTTVSALPACTAGTQGARMFVTDQNTAIAYHGAVTGSGTNKQGVTCDGTAWYQD